MTNKWAVRILKLEQAELMSVEKSSRDWEYITAIDIAINVIVGWQELKETITELGKNDGTGTQQEVCKFLLNLMNVLEKEEKDNDK